MSPLYALCFPQIHLYFNIHFLSLLHALVADRPSEYKRSEAPTPRLPPSRSRKRQTSATPDADSDGSEPLALSSARISMKDAHTAAVGATSSRAGRRSTMKSYKEVSDDEIGSSANRKVEQEDAGDEPPSSDDDLPLVRKSNRANTNGKVKQEESDDEPPSSDDERPLTKKCNRANANGKAKPSPRKRVKKDESDVDASGASEVEKWKSKPAAKRVKKEVKGGVDSDGELSATPKHAKTKQEPKEPKLKKPKEEEEEEEEAVYKWWNDENPEADGSKKWDALRHAGVFFPPPYEPLPSNVKMLYNGL